MRKRRKKRYSVTRRWKRKDSPLLAPGDLDPSGLLEIVNPDLGTKNGERYASARCRCGCTVGHISVRITHFRAGKASCPTRRRAHNRRAMIRKEHIKQMQLLGDVLRGVGLPAAAIKAGVEYAQRLTTDTALRAEVTATFNQSLAERDFKRADQVVQKFGNAPVKVAVPNAPVTANKPKLPDLLAHNIVCELGGRYEYTVKGQAWHDAGKPDLSTWPPPKAPALTPAQMPPPEKLEDKLRPLIPYLDDAQHGFLTFRRVPDNLRQIDGNNIRELLVTAGIIDAKLNLTDNGKAWLQQSSGA